MSTDRQFARGRVFNPFLYSNGCLPRCVPFTSASAPQTILISPGIVRDSTNRFDMVLNETKTLSFAFPSDPGPNRIDRIMNYAPDAIPDGTWFAIYVIGDSLSRLPTATVAVPIVPADYAAAVTQLPFPAPQYDSILKATYDIYRHVGWCSFYTNPYTALGTVVRPFTTENRGMNVRRHNYTFKYSPLTGNTNGNNFIFGTGTFNEKVMPQVQSATYNLKLENIITDGYLGLINTGTNPVLPVGATIANLWPATFYGSANGPGEVQDEDVTLPPFWSPGLLSYGLGSIVVAPGDMNFTLYVESCDYHI